MTLNFLQIQGPWGPIETYAAVIWGIVGIIFLAIIWWIYVVFIAPAELGRSLGIYSLVGLTGGKNHLILRGLLIDCTESFINPQLYKSFKPLAWQAVYEQLQNETDTLRRTKLIGALRTLHQNPIYSYCRVVALRHIDRKKHYLIQFGRVEKPLSEYATFSKTPLWSWAVGLISRGVIIGDIWTIPASIRSSWGLAKRFRGSVWHYFLPVDHSLRTTVTLPPPGLGEIVAAMKPWTKAGTETKYLRKRVSDAEDRAEKAMREASVHATMVDSFITMAKDLGLERAWASFTEKFTARDALVLVALVGGGAYGVSLLNYNPVIGAVGGLIIGLIYLGRR